MEGDGGARVPIASIEAMAFVGGDTGERHVGSF